MKRKILTVFVFLIATIIVLLTALTLLEYNPKDEENLSVIGKSTRESVKINEDYSIISFNKGYGDRKSVV